MPPFRKILCADHLGADDFVGRDMEPVEHTLTIKDVRIGKPPAGKKERPQFFFNETPKSAFLPNSQVKAIAHQLRRGNTEDWVGAKITITSRKTTMAGQATTGMMVVRCWFDRTPAATTSAPVVTDGE